MTGRTSSKCGGLRGHQASGGDSVEDVRRTSGRGQPLETPAQTARYLHVSRATLARLVSDEDLPAVVLRVGPAYRDRFGNEVHRRVLRFRISDVEGWLAGRRERQVRGLLEGARYSRRRSGSAVDGQR
jgi:hypothetical protein